MRARAILLAAACSTTQMLCALQSAVPLVNLKVTARVEVSMSGSEGLTFVPQFSESKLYLFKAKLP